MSTPFFDFLKKKLSTGFSTKKAPDINQTLFPFKILFRSNHIFPRLPESELCNRDSGVLSALLFLPFVFSVQ